jgi:hypothetical protein
LDDARSKEYDSNGISKADWKRQHAALVTIVQIAESSAKVMMLKFFQDPHPRVRWATIKAVG